MILDFIKNTVCLHKNNIIKIAVDAGQWSEVKEFDDKTKEITNVFQAELFTFMIDSFHGKNNIKTHFVTIGRYEDTVIDPSGRIQNDYSSKDREFIKKVLFSLPTVVEGSEENTTKNEAFRKIMNDFDKSIASN